VSLSTSRKLEAEHAMHYIRFLKPLRLLPGSSPTLGAKVTVTTDLGESFLCLDIPLSAEVWLEDGKNALLAKVYQWKGSNGMRSFEITLPVPSGVGMYTLQYPIQASI
jgi:hypothetical protein